jgi:hypothetical protein
MQFKLPGIGMRRAHRSQGRVVTRFQIRTDYLRQFDVHTVGSSIHKEYWIPAEELANFNANIVGQIEVIAEFHGE